MKFLELLHYFLSNILIYLNDDRNLGKASWDILILLDWYHSVHEILKRDRVKDDPSASRIVINARNFQELGVDIKPSYTAITNIKLFRNNQIRFLLGTCKDSLESLLDSFLLKHLFLYGNTTMSLAELEFGNIDAPSVFVEWSGSDKGWCLVTNKCIRTGQQFLPYYGELLKTSEVKRRYREEYDKLNMNYVLTVKEHLQKEPVEKKRKRASFEKSDNLSDQLSEDELSPVILRTNVDATRVGGLARFANHSCDPNTEIIMVRKPENLLGIPVFQAIRDILPFEEISFDYGMSEATSASASDSSTNMDEEGHFSKRKKCFCGARNCHGWLPYDET